MLLSFDLEHKPHSQQLLLFLHAGVTAAWLTRMKGIDKVAGAAATVAKKIADGNADVDQSLKHSNISCRDI